MAEEFSVRIEPHGRTFTVPAGKPVLEAALDAGLNLPHSCKSGHCGSCRAQLLEGRIQYPHGRPLGLSAEEEREGLVLLCQARAGSPLHVRARSVQSVADVQIKTLPCRIERLVRLAPDVLQVWLRLPAVEPLSFQPGQYLDVLLEGGRRRSFSIASPPHDSGLLELHVRQVAGGDFTARLFAAGAEALTAGSLLRIEGPVGQFVYRAGTGPLIMVAGGTGFAPLKSILRHLLENRIRRRVHFYWGARTAADLYQDELARDWAEHHAAQLTYHAVLSEGEPQAAHQRRGWVHEALLTDHPDLGPFEVYAAGPPALIEVLRRETPGHGLPPERLYFDSFDYAPDLRR